MKVINHICLLLIAISGILASCDEFDNPYVTEDDQGRYVSYQFLHGFKDKVEITLPSGVNGNNWMQHVQDNQRLCKMAIPGTHDALTGMGWYQNETQYLFNVTAISQVSTLDDQLDKGIRFFDVRPVVSTDTVTTAKVLRTAHGISETKITFAEVLDKIRTFLGQNPSEGVMLKIQNDSGIEDQIDYFFMYDSLITDYRQAYPELFVEDWHPDMTMGELRGKILLMNRISRGGMQLYAKPVGAFCQKWPSGDKELYKNIANITEYEDMRQQLSKVSSVVGGWKHADTTASMYVQDYYICDDSLRLETKKAEVIALARISQLIPDDENTWVINHCSGYTEVSPSGYAKNAATIHPLLIDYILEQQAMDGAPVRGIIPVDFACYDNLQCIINGGIPMLSHYLYGMKPMTQSLTNLLIMSNLNNK